MDLGYDTAHLSDPTVAVIGGTGRTGRRVVDRLRARPVIVRIGSRTALEDALLDRIVEPLGEYLAGDAEVGLDLVEAVHPGPTRRARSVATTAHR